LKDNIFKITLKEKILFLISIGLLSNGFTFPVGIMILIWILIRVSIRTVGNDSKINTNFVN
jgi:hypothetical protein